MTRNFKSAANLFIDAIPTFNSPEVVSFNKLVFYTVLTSMISLERADLRKKVIFAKGFNWRLFIPPMSWVLSRNSQMLRSSWTPSINAIIKPSLKDSVRILLSSEPLVLIIDQIAEDQYLNAHKKFYIREMRLVVYSQFLESYKTVTLENMAQAFGVSAEFIDK